MPALVQNTPPIVVGPTTKRATRPNNKLPQYLTDEIRNVKREPFSAEKHMDYQHPKRIYAMKEIGLEGHGVSPNAVSEPFSLFNQEAIQQMRTEIFSEQVLKDCQYASTFNRNMVRGMGPTRAPFTYAAWHSPQVLAAISEVAGIDLVPVFDFDIANINISINDKEQLAQEKNYSDDDKMSSVAWHYDSFPFVCVTMMSDCKDMVGGETALRTINGEYMKVRGPNMGTAVILQGRYIEHQALKAFGGRERITMVTALRPRSAFVKDESVLTGVRGISNIDELYSQYTQYRLDNLEERIRARLDEERERQLVKGKYDVAQARRWLLEQRDFLDAMLTEVVEIED